MFFSESNEFPYHLLCDWCLHTLRNEFPCLFKFILVNRLISFTRNVLCTHNLTFHSANIVIFYHLNLKINQIPSVFCTMVDIVLHSVCSNKVTLSAIYQYKHSIRNILDLKHNSLNNCVRCLIFLFHYLIDKHVYKLTNLKN